MLFDGAFGSRLIELGLPAGKPPEAWLQENPTAIKQVHKEYAEAGTDVIAACTFGGNRLRLQKASLEGSVEEINRVAVEFAKEAAGNRAYVAADLGPTGEFFKPAGVMTEDTACEVFEEQVSILTDTEIDFFFLETHYDLKEALICIEACRKIAPDTPVAASLTFNATPRGFFTVMGNPMIDSLHGLVDAGCFLVGANCTLEGKGMQELALELSDKIDTPLIFQANAGNPQISPDGILYPQGPVEFAQYCAKMIESGAAAIGGCCGTTAEHIKELRKAIDSKIS